MADTPKARPIIMQAESVRATLAGLKTQTRRVMKVQPMDATQRVVPWLVDDEWQEREPSGLPLFISESADEDADSREYGCPFGKIGDRLWVRERIDLIDRGTVAGGYVPTVVYLADSSEIPIRDLVSAEKHSEIDSSILRPVRKQSIHMYRWASRLLLEIVDVRVQRLSDMTEADARAEGETTVWPLNPDVGAFVKTWNRLNAKRGYSWESDCWVWALTYRRVAEGGIK